MTATLFLDDRQRAFAVVARTATLATIAPDGRPRLVPICFVVGTNGPDGRARFYSPLDQKPKATSEPRDLARVRNILARPDVTLLVDRWSEDWLRLGWLQIDARAELLEPVGTDFKEHATAMAALRSKYPQYENHHLEERPMLRFTVGRVVAWGDLGLG